MENDEYDNIDELQNNGEHDDGQIGLVVGILGLAYGTVMGMKSWYDRRMLKKERKRVNCTRKRLESIR